MYAAGIRQIELCSPGYAQFKSLADGKQTQKIIEDNGLKCISAHFNYNELEERPGAGDRVGAGRRHDADGHGEPARARVDRTA